MSSTRPASIVLKELLDCLNDNRGDLLEYDAEQQRLVPYPWPLDGNLEPVHVDNFAMHYESHRFSYPACFCPVLSGSVQKIQTLIRFSPNESMEKRLIAVCEKDICGYFANLVFRPGSLVQYYPLQVSGNTLLPCAFAVSGDAPARRPLAEFGSYPSKTLGITQGYPAGLRFIPIFYPPAGFNGPSIPTLLYRLNSAHRPGLEERIFHQLFTRCECGIVSTTRTFEGHRCRTTIDTTIVGTDIEGMDDGKLLRLLLRFDVGNPSLGAEVFYNLFACCVCGMITTKRRFRVHECLPVF